MAKPKHNVPVRGMTVREKQVADKLVEAEKALAQAVAARGDLPRLQEAQVTAMNRIVEASLLINPIKPQTTLEYIAEFLHPEGKLFHRLPRQELERIFALGDGFGPIGDAVFRINSGWDWSHIRDSSPGALWRIRCELKELEARILRDAA